MAYSVAYRYNNISSMPKKMACLGLIFEKQLCVLIPGRITSLTSQVILRESLYVVNISN